MTPEERQRMLDLCRQLRDDKDQQKIIDLADQLNRFLDAAMSQPRAKAKRATGG